MNAKKHDHPQKFEVNLSALKNISWAIRNDPNIINVDGLYINIVAPEILYSIKSGNIVTFGSCTDMYVIVGCMLDGVICFQDGDMINTNQTPFCFKEALNRMEFEKNFKPIKVTETQPKWFPIWPSQQTETVPFPVCLFEETDDASVSVVVENGKSTILFHYTVIKRNFPYFYNKLLDPDTKKYTGRKIVCDEISFDVMNIIKWYIYTKSTPKGQYYIIKSKNDTQSVGTSEDEDDQYDKNEANLIEAMSVAHRFELWEFVELAVDDILASFNNYNSSIENLCSFYDFADRCGLEYLRGKIVYDTSLEEFEALLGHPGVKLIDIVWAFRLSDRDEEALAICKIIQKSKFLKPIMYIPPIFALLDTDTLNQIYKLNIFDEQSMLTYMNIATRREIDQLVASEKKLDVAKALTQLDIQSKIQFIEIMAESSSKKRKLEDS